MWDYNSYIMSEIAVAIPNYNSVMYLPYVMTRLQHQKIPNLPVMIMDQGSTDGTMGWASEVMGRGYYNKKSQEKNAIILSVFSRLQDPKKHPYVNAMDARVQMARLARTPYIFFLDPDVLIKQLSLRRLQEFLEKEKAAYVGMKYEPDAYDGGHPMVKGKHIMMGATLWERETFLKIPEFTNEHMNQGCDCNFCYREIEKMGFKGLHSNIQAEHLKGVFT
jgi:glycosyltransferase involved in cell wall biosynthesis